MVNHFARIASLEMGISLRRFTPEALEILMHRPWPGNVRQLQNAVRRIVMFSPDSVLRAQDLKVLEDRRDAEIHPEVVSGSVDTVETYKQAKDRLVNQFTHDYLMSLLTKTAGNITRAAELSGLGRASLWKIMHRLGIRSDAYK